MSRLSTKFAEAADTGSTTKIIDNVKEESNLSICRPMGCLTLTDDLPEKITLPKPLSHESRNTATRVLEVVTVAFVKASHAVEKRIR